MERHSAIVVSAYGIASGTAMLCVSVPFIYGLPPLHHVSLKAWLALAASGFLCTAATTLLWNWGMTAQFPPRRQACCSNMEPPHWLHPRRLPAGYIETLGPSARLGGLPHPRRSRRHHSPAPATRVREQLLLHLTLPPRHHLNLEDRRPLLPSHKNPITPRIVRDPIQHRLRIHHLVRRKQTRKVDPRDHVPIVRRNPRNPVGMPHNICPYFPMHELQLIQSFHPLASRLSP